MIIYKYLNNFLVDDKIFTSLDKFNFKNEKYIITNSPTDIIDYDKTLKNKVYDYKINYWLNNNQDNTYTYPKSLSEVEVEIKSIKTRFKPELLQQTNRYTIFEYEINKLFSLEYNVKKMLRLKEKRSLNENINKKAGKILRPTYDFLDNIEKGCYYDFKNATGRLYPRGFNVIRFDNNFIDVFINEGESYYKIDFKCFYPRFLYLYTGNELFLDENFYDIYAEKLGVERQTFKEELFNKFTNGGKIDNQEFIKEFGYLYELKNKIRSPFLNYSGRKIYCKDYQKLGYLISTTAEDALKYLLSYLYNNFKEDVSFIWLKFDELFVKGKEENVKKLTEVIKEITKNLIVCKVSQVC